MHLQRAAQTQEFHAGEQMTAPCPRCLFKAEKAAVQTCYLTRNVTAALWQTQKNILKIRLNKHLLGIEMTHISKKNPRSVAVSKRMKAAAGVGATVSKLAIPLCCLEPLPIGLAFVFVTLPCSSVFHARTHFAEITFALLCCYASPNVPASHRPETPSAKPRVRRA